MRSSVSSAKPSASGSERSLRMRATLSPESRRSCPPRAISAESISASAVDTHADSLRPARSRGASTATARRAIGPGTTLGGAGSPSLEPPALRTRSAARRRSRRRWGSVGRAGAPGSAGALAPRVDPARAPALGEREEARAGAAWPWPPPWAPRRAAARHQLEEHHAERVDIRGGRQRLALDLLGAHVAGAAQHLLVAGDRRVLGERLAEREAEVRHHHPHAALSRISATRITLLLLKSRWMTCAACAASSADAICSASRSTSSGGRRPCLARYSWSVSPPAVPW